MNRLSALDKKRLQQIAGIRSYDKDLLSENILETTLPEDTGRTEINSIVGEAEDDDFDTILDKLSTDDEVSDEEDILDEPEETDNWYADDSDTPDEFEKEPAMKDIKKIGNIDNSRDKSSKLDGLIKLKDALLAKLKAGTISIEDYKREIGNIPQQIKMLQADLEKELSLEDPDDLGDDMDL